MISRCRTESDTLHSGSVTESCWKLLGGSWRPSSNYPLNKIWLNLKLKLMAEVLWTNLRSADKFQTHSPSGPNRTSREQSKNIHHTGSNLDGLENMTLNRETLKFIEVKFLIFNKPLHKLFDHAFIIYPFLSLQQIFLFTEFSIKFLILISIQHLGHTLL